jgi:REP-associated tyrosine transposase
MHKMTALQIGGTDDHLHALVQAPPIYAPSQIAQFLKGESSKWIHEEFSHLRAFGWHDGYAASTVSKLELPGVILYIQNQRGASSQADVSGKISRVSQRARD